jgi:hypothetical protein
MIKLSPGIHGILDYLTVLFLLISPALFEMHYTAAEFTYALAVVHLALTLSTNFRPGAFKIIPLRIHGLIELVVSVGLVGVSILFRMRGDNVGFYYYLVFSATLFIVWAASDYKPVSRRINGKYS